LKRQPRECAGRQRHVMLDARAEDTDVDQRDSGSTEASDEWLRQDDALDTSGARGIHGRGAIVREGNKKGRARGRGLRGSKCWSY
jgi:hypothetical protein